MSAGMGQARAIAPRRAGAIPTTPTAPTTTVRLGPPVDGALAAAVRGARTCAEPASSFRVGAPLVSPEPICYMSPDFKRSWRNW